MDKHLGYEKNSISDNNNSNSRNDYGKKPIKSEWGESEIEVPRDRNGTFEPKIISKRQTRTDDIEARILAMWQKVCQFGYRRKYIRCGSFSKPYKPYYG